MIFGDAEQTYHELGTENRAVLVRREGREEKKRKKECKNEKKVKVKVREERKRRNHGETQPPALVWPRNAQMKPNALWTVLRTKDKTQ